MRALVNAVLPGALQKAIRKRLYHRRLSTYPTRTVRHKIFGQELTIWLGDRTAEKWYDQDVRKLPFVALLEQRLYAGSGPIFYVGGYYCVYAIALAKMVGSGGTVVAVEANPDFYDGAKRNIEINNLDNIEVLHQAISDTPGTLRFSLGHTVSSGQRGQPEVVVPAGTIDGLTSKKGNPRLVVVDVEGYECFALRGASRTLRSSADWCVEVHSGCGLEHFGGDLETVLSYFPADRFSLYMARDYGADGAVPLDLSSPLVKERFHLIAMSCARILEGASSS